MSHLVALVNITEDPEAINWLLAPQPCGICGGAGTIGVAFEVEDGVLLGLRPCPGCNGLGWSLWVSWN